MSENIKDVRPAFPWHQSPGNQNNLGLTNREWFAGMALQGLIASESEDFSFGKRHHDRASWAVASADAMLSALERNP